LVLSCAFAYLDRCYTLFKTFFFFFFFQAEDGIRDATVTGVQTCALPIYKAHQNPEKDSVSGFWCALLGIAVAACFAPAATAQEVPYKPYIELGDAGAFGTKDQMIVAWQTDRKRVVEGAVRAVVECR